MKLISICKSCCNKCLNTSETGSIGFFVHKNQSLPEKIKALCDLEAEIFMKTFFTVVAICKIQDDGYIGLGEWKHSFSDC